MLDVDHGPLTATHASQSGRDRVLLAAADRFLRHGYAATTLRDIAADAGIKAGSIYYHFDSKESLLREVLARGIVVMEQAFARAAEATAGADPATRIGAHVRAHLSALFDHGPLTANHVSAFHTVPQEVRRAMIPVRDAYERRWADLLVELQAAGAMDPGLDPGLSRLALMGAMNAAVEWFDPSRQNLDDLAATITRQFWHGAKAA